ncbi:MAG: phosphate signaling complex protein PhoU [Candidatus Planktophila sp.]|nr:phosphate signaling complex protein PhoU [Candidatus Planktophila sp.]
MRDAFHEELDAIQATLVTMGEMVATAMSRSSEALLKADVKLAEQVISEDEKLDTIQHDLEARAINLMARQQPVAQDLRILVTSLRMSADLERMGDLCHHIAKLARMRYPEVAVPAELVKTIESMGTTAVKIIEKSTHVVKTQNLQAAIELETDDDEMDKLHRALFVALLDDSWSHGIEAAIDMTLLGRYYERCADHAVSIARRVYFLVKGEYASESQAAI